VVTFAFDAFPGNKLSQDAQYGIRNVGLITHFSKKWTLPRCVLDVTEGIFS